MLIRSVNERCTAGTELKTSRIQNAVASRIINSKATVNAAEMRRDPRQPSRFEKKKNILDSVPPHNPGQTDTSEGHDESSMVNLGADGRLVVVRSPAQPGHATAESAMASP